MPPQSSQPPNTEYILLGLLAERSMHGYDLFRELQSHPGLAMIWHVKQSMVYALLEKLAGQGFLDTHLLAGGAHPPRKEYSITAAGREAFEAWRASPVGHPRDLRQNFLARLFFARRAAGQPAQALVESQKEACRAWLEHLQCQVEEMQGEERAFERCVLAFRIRQVEAILAWLDGCVRELP